MNLSNEDHADRVEHGLVPITRLRAASLSKEHISDRMAFHCVPGVSVVVVYDGQVAWARGYGIADVERPAPITTETLFQAASISKPVAVAGVLRLVEQGMLDLDADVNDYLRSWKIPPTDGWQPRVTIRQLASHSAGLTVHGFPGYPVDQAVPDVLGVLRGAPPTNTGPVVVDTLPGLQFRYSGGGMTVLQLLIEDVTGETFAAYMQRSMLDPLGMSRSGYFQPLPENLMDRAASGHRVGGGLVHGRWHTHPELAAAGLWTTPSDLARFVIAFQDMLNGESDSILSASTVQEMLTPQVEPHIGLGFWLDGSGETMRFGHGGSNQGYQCKVVHYAHRSIGAVVMTNSDTGSPLVEEIFQAIARECDWPGYLERDPQPVAITPDRLTEYVGDYELPSGERITVTTDGHSLLFDALTQDPFTSTPIGNDQFVAEPIALRLTFTRRDAGEVADLKLEQNERERVASKVI